MKRAEDAETLRLVFCALLRIPDANWPNHAIAKAFAHALIEGFEEDFITLTSEDLDDLKYESTRTVRPGTTRTDIIPLEMSNKKKIRAVLAYYHALSANNC